MITFHSLKTKPDVFAHFTGLKVAAFYEVLPAFTQAYEDHLDERDRQREQPRQRERGGGRTSVLASPEDKLLFILFYFRFYPVQSIQGYFFGLSQSQTNDWIHRLTPLLHQALGDQRQLPARKTRAISAVLRACPGLEFIIDGTERPIGRPKEKEKQHTHYSGKKKRHTVKNNVITDKKTGKIKVLSPTVAGKRHDKKLADEHGVIFPRGSKLWKDTGFQGYDPAHTTTFQPKKKPKGGELTPEEKRDNATISRERIGVEHSIGGVKVFRIVHDIFRNMRDGFDDLVMEVACGLHNLRLDYPLTVK